MPIIKSDIQEVRDQLFLDHADGVYLSNVTANIGLPRPLFGFSNDSIWRAIVRRLALDYRQIENCFADLLEVYFGPRITHTSVLSSNASVGDEEIIIADQITLRRLPQRGTVVIDETLASAETIEFPFLDPLTGAMTLSTALANAHTAVVDNAEGTLAADAVATDTVVVLTNADQFPTTGYPFPLLIGAGEAGEEVVTVTGRATGTGDSFAFASPTVTLTDAGAAFVAAMVGAFIEISGATSAGNNGIFPITAVPGGTSISYENLDGVAEAFTGTWTVLNALQVSALANNHTGVVESFITSAFVSLVGSGGVLELADTSAFPSSGIVRVMEDGGTPTEDVEYFQNNVDDDQLILKSKLTSTYTTAEVTLLRSGEKAQLAQVQVKGIGWDIFVTEARKLQIYLPRTLQENRLLDVSFLHDQIIGAAPSSTIVGTPSAGDTQIELADASAFPMAGNIIIDDGGGNEENIGYNRIDRYVTRLVTNGDRASGTITTGDGSTYAADPPGGETFTIDDGVNPSDTFEFDQNASVGGGNIAITMTGAETSAQMRDLIVAAINGVGATLRITASPGVDNGTTAVVNLVNDVYGSAGNTTSSETVADSSFVITNMTGGGSGLSIGSTVLNVDDVTPIKAAEELTKDLILSRGTADEETVTWTTIDEDANTITLSAGTTNEHTPAGATGSITTDAGANLPADGDTFTVSDGTTAIIFEFDNNATVTAGNVPVDITGAPSADTMRDRIIEAMNFALVGWGVKAVNGGSATVDLENLNLGTAGNVAITDTFTPLGAWAFTGMSTGSGEGPVEVSDPDVLFLTRGLANSHIAAETVDLDEDEYASTDLEIGDPTVAVARPDRFQGPYMYDLGTLLAESIETTLDENIAGPERLLVETRPPGRSLEVRDASLFETTGRFDIRVGANQASDETLDATSITLRRTVEAAALTINANHAPGVQTLTLSAVTPLPTTSQYRILINKGGGNEEIVIFNNVNALNPSTQIDLDAVTTDTHNIGETVEIMADVVRLSENTTFAHPGVIPFDQRTTILPGPMTSDSAVCLVQEVRDLIEVDSTGSFPSTGAQAYLNFGQRLAKAESRFVSQALAGATVLSLEDTSAFPSTGAAPYFIEIGVDLKEIESLEVSANNTTLNQLTVSSATILDHEIGEWVRYNPGAERLVTYQEVDVGGLTSLGFTPAISFDEKHLIDEPVHLSTVSTGIPNQTGTDYPFYLPSDWADRLQFIFDKARAAGVQVVVIDNR